MIDMIEISSINVSNIWMQGFCTSIQRYINFKFINVYSKPFENGFFIMCKGTP